MKIAIIGAHRVGKTTLAEQLQEQMPTFVLNREPYYELEESGYQFAETPYVDDFLKQFSFSVQQISESENNTLFDRCPIDILAYIHAIDPGKSLQSLFETTYSVIHEIDLLVFVPIEDPDIIHCDTADFPKLRRKVNEILYNWIDDWGIKTIEVKGTLINRKKQVLDAIKQQANHL
ncbi:AAA domain-containing protein [Filimonas lacunae]|uniref:AAA domain-containing protein n=1 Tax=Filimonas lacunae TaxID=477680 RepID=A0A173MGC7_9BACT|nr:ATP-binding protein [Filimonas lacunae]BAV06653.1 hypothetical protein FLA_2672 [Filimonas lacunae]SIT27767.1 AAA domain-containing protein [Filimonas lacunae]